MQHPISALIHARRTTLRMTQTQLAARVGVSRALIAMWEGGQRLPRSSHVEAAAVALEVDPAELRVASTCLRIERADRKTAIRPPYPIGATLAQMLAVPGCARQVHNDARSLLPPEDYAAVVETFPRDTRHELLFVFHLLRQAARVVRTSPLDFKCWLHVLDDFDAVGASHHRHMKRMPRHIEIRNDRLHRPVSVTVDDIAGVATREQFGVVALIRQRFAFPRAHAVGGELDAGVRLWRCHTAEGSRVPRLWFSVLLRPALFPSADSPGCRGITVRAAHSWGDDSSR